jgi:pseudaminic acid synthase
MTIDCNKPDFIVSGGTPWDGRKLYDLYSETPLPYEWHGAIIERCKSKGLMCFSTPYDITALEFLDRFELPALKVSSFEIMDIPLIREIAARGLPVIISTGIATLTDIERAVNACLRESNDQIALLKCTSAYPASYNSMNLMTIPNLAETFGTVVGVSDHTLGSEVPVASVALGAKIIEKHFTLDRSLGGPDSGFSLEPHELADMVRKVRNTEEALGRVDYSLSESKKRSRESFGRSLYFVEDVSAGTIVSFSNVRSIRPGKGLSPMYLEEVVGKVVRKDITKGTPVSFTLLE